MNRCFAIAIGLVFALITSASAQNTSSFQVWNASPLTKLSDNKTDSVVVKFDTIAGKIRCTIQCEIRTPFGGSSTRRLQMVFNDFDGLGQYTPILGGGFTYWQNFSRDSTCACVDNSVNKVVITKWSPADRQLEGTFEFRCESFDKQGGAVLPYRIRSGSFRWGGKDKIVLKSDPKDTIRIGQLANDTTFNMVISSEELGTALPGVTLKVLDKTRTGSTAYINGGVTDALGNFNYEVQLRKDAAAGDYEIKFFGVKDDHDSSDTSTVLIRYKNRYWDFKCAGVSILTFDAGEGQEWKPISEGSPIVSASGVIKIADYVEVHGKVRIVTTEGAEKVFVDSGEVQVPTTDDDGQPTLVPFNELLGNDKSVSMPDCTGLVNLVRDSIVKGFSKKLPGGIELSIEKFSFFRRPTGNGMEIEAKVKLGPGSKLGCTPVNENDIFAEGPSRAITIGVAITRNGFDNLRIKVENISATDYFCIKEISANLDNFNKTCGMTAKVGFPVKGTQLTAGFGAQFKSGTGQFGFNDMMLDSMLAEFELDECRIIPETPFCFKALKFSASGLANRTTGTGITGRAGIVINTLEQALLDKAPWIRNFSDTVAIAQLEGTLQYTHPLIFTGIATARLIRLDKPFKSKPWQGEGSYTLSLDWYNGITASLVGNFGHLGGDDYFISGSITERLYWNPMIGVSGNATGTVRIPNPGSDLLEVPGVGTVLRFMKLSGWIPQTLGTASITTYLNQDDGFLLKGSVDVSQHPISFIRDFGIMSAAISCKNGDWDVNLQQGMTPSAFQRKKGERVEAYPAQTIDTITVDATMSRVFVMISGAATAPASTIVKPDGTEFTVSAADSTIKRYATPGNEMVQWTLIAPTPGDWILKLNNPQAGDEVEVMVSRAVARPFEISSSQTDSNVTISWNGVGAPPNSEVRVFIDADGDGFDGDYIGKATEQAGAFQFVLPSVMPACTYHVYALRNAPGEPDTKTYSSNVITKSNGVPVPVNVVAVSNQTGHVTVSWRSPAGTSPSGFLIYAVDANNVETHVASAATDQRFVEFDLADHENKKIVVRAYDDMGLKSCPTAAMSITTEVAEDGSYHESVVGKMLIMPNPTSGSTTVEYQLNGCVAEDIVVYNMIGNVVASIPTPVSAGDVYRVAWDATGIASGMYLIKIRCQSGELVGMVSIAK